MADGPAYVILGRGRWAKKMQPIIAGESRSAVAIGETRQKLSESQEAYLSRLAEGMKSSRAQIAWLCVTPGPHVTLMIQAAIEAGLHSVVEKPWYGSAEDTKRLQAQAVAKGLIIAVHYEYCVLEEVEKWRQEFYPGAGLRLGGHFFLSRSDQTGISALDNLGCHLLAIREWAVPSSEVSQIACAYEQADERLVWLEKGRQKIGSIDLLNHQELIVQRFMKRVEAALDGAALPFDLEFGLRVAVELNALKIQK
jgi:predicted dehydrogenase